MSLNLDTRQRAMLQEMGHPVWWPESAVPALPVDVQTAPTPHLDKKPPAELTHRAEAATQSVAPSPVQPAAMVPVAAPFAAPVQPRPAEPNTAQPAPTPTAAPAAAPTAVVAQALPQDFPRVRFALRTPVLIDVRDAPAIAAPEPTQSTQPAWLVVAELPDGAFTSHAAGQLVINMLRAMRLTDAPVYWVPLARIPAGQDDAEGLPNHSIEALINDYQPCMALLLGLPAARHLLGGEQAFSSLRQHVHTVGSATPAVVTYDPSHLLRTPQAKANTWADLCKALAHTGR